MKLNNLDHQKTWPGEIGPWRPTALTLLVGLLVINYLILVAYSWEIVLFLALLLVVVCLIQKSHKLLFYGVIVGVLSYLTLLLDIEKTPKIILAIALGLGYWAPRFFLLGAFGYSVVKAVSPSEWINTLYILRLPNFLAIPAAVMYRFVPVVIREMVAINGAMRLRGLLSASAITRPLSVIEMGMVALLTSSMKSADDLSSSALLRGLGTTKKPTPLIEQKFSVGDVIAIVLIVVAIVIWRLSS